VQRLTDFFINSFGGCGSKYLATRLCEFTDSKQLGKIHLHERHPSQSVLNNQTRIIFLFANPITAVKSFFWRQQAKTDQHGFYPSLSPGDMAWPHKHCINLGGDFSRLQANWTLRDYLTNGRDLFGLTEFVMNWVNHQENLRAMFLRYETMWQHVEEISQFIDLKPNEFLDLGEQLPRTSGKLIIDATEEYLLNEMYGVLADEIRSFDDVFYR
jgi:hypothetical protein